MATSDVRSVCSLGALCATAAWSAERERPAPSVSAILSKIPSSIPVKSACDAMKPYATPSMSMSSAAAVERGRGWWGRWWAWREAGRRAALVASRAKPNPPPERTPAPRRSAEVRSIAFGSKLRREQKGGVE